ncbi:MAG: hypothetical protein QGD96_01175 [Anaerolineae bacterium]|nr:hypothetical protein [Anaerolineae bacterium]
MAILSHWCHPDPLMHAPIVTISRGSDVNDNSLIKLKTNGFVMLLVMALSVENLA